jgi:hypothetical protein
MQHAIKFMCPAVLAHNLRQAALARGTCVADIARRACEAYVGTPEPSFDEALVERHTDDGGKKVVGALLSGKLASAIARLAAETGTSQSHVLRGLIRDQLRARGLLPSSAAPLDA